MLQKNTNHTIGVTAGGTNDVRVLQHATLVSQTSPGSLSLSASCPRTVRAQLADSRGCNRRTPLMPATESEFDQMAVAATVQPPVAAWASLIINKMLST